MQNDTPVKTLIKSAQFREKIGAYFGCELTRPLQCKKFGHGFSKVVWEISSPEIPRPFLVKEIRFKDKLAHEDSEETNDTLQPEEALYELETIRTIQRLPGLAKQFPRNIGLFAATHPVLDSYTGDVELKGEVVRMDRVDRLLNEDQRGVSLFITEEIAQGRAPTADEVAQAERIRAEGMKTNPRVWLTVDCASNDFVVSPDGSFVFFDVGDVVSLTPDEESMLRKFMSADKSR